MHNRAVGHGAGGALAVLAPAVPFSHGDAGCEHGGVPHVVGFDDLEPLVGERAAHGAADCFDNAHIFYLPAICLSWLFLSIIQGIKSRVQKFMRKCRRGVPNTTKEGTGVRFPLFLRRSPYW